MDPRIKEPGGKKLLIVSLTALGIVYGDIGTSPLYALRACFVGDNAVPFTSENIFGVLSLILFGFMESPNVPQALRLSQKYNLRIKPDHVTYYIGRQTIVPNPQGGAMALWRKVLFVFLARNAAQPITFYHLSLEQVFELGIRVEF
jgi:K+ transporter